MKKVVFLLLSIVGMTFAADTELSAYTQLASFATITAGIVLGLAAFGAAIGMGNSASAALSGIARNPSIASKLTSVMLISLALIEAQVIYALVIAFVLLFSNPLIGEPLKKAIGL